MPDKRTHRGAHPEDSRLFSPSALPALRSAALDLCWLLNRGYAMRAALKLVGDRYRLTERQRAAVMRCVCTDEALARRRSIRVDGRDLDGANVVIDGFNVLTTVEAALGGGVILEGRDDCYRDILGIHGSYRRVEETMPAIGLVGDALTTLGAGRVVWLLDSPVSNSGRLKGILLESAAARGWDWSVELLFSPDRALKETTEIVATSDGPVLDQVSKWVNLTRIVVDGAAPGAHIVRMFSGGAETVGSAREGAIA